mgnify:CR=1 FL=1
MTTTVAIIVACAVLHNMAIKLGDYEEEPEEYLLEEIHNDNEEHVGGNTAMRNYIINNFLQMFLIDNCILHTFCFLKILLWYHMLPKRLQKSL